MTCVLETLRGRADEGMRVGATGDPVGLIITRHEPIRSVVEIVVVCVLGCSPICLLVGLLVCVSVFMCVSCCQRYAEAPYIRFVSSQGPLVELISPSEALCWWSLASVKTCVWLKFARWQDRFCVTCEVAMKHPDSDPHSGRRAQFASEPTSDHEIDVGIVGAFFHGLWCVMMQTNRFNEVQRGSAGRRATLEMRCPTCCRGVWHKPE